MRVELLGVQVLDFVTDDNKPIKGLKLHIAYEDAHVSGFKVDSKFVSADLCQGLGISAANLEKYIGGSIEVSTDLKGKIVGVVPIRSDSE